MDIGFQVCFHSINLILEYKRFKRLLARKELNGETTLLKVVKEIIARVSIENN